LFPDEKGRVPKKESVVDGWDRLWEQAVTEEEEEKGEEEGRAHITGHSARRTGAKLLTRLLWTVSQVAFWGRWASRAVLGYIEEVYGESSESWALAKQADDVER